VSADDGPQTNGYRVDLQNLDRAIVGFKHVPISRRFRRGEEVNSGQLKLCN